MTICVILPVELQDDLRFEIDCETPRAWINQESDDFHSYYAECDLSVLETFRDELTRAIEAAKSLNNG